MVLLEDKIYKETKNIVVGKKQLSPLANELSTWLYVNYSVKMLNMQFSKLDNCERYRLLYNLKEY